MVLLQDRHVPAGMVQDAADLVDRDPQLAHRNHWRYLPHAEMGDSLYNGPPFQFASGPVGPRFSAPLLGEHTRTVLAERLGQSDEAIDALIDAGVLV
jgi:benzylsuccinate CoA-transferase BbsF subunit